MDKYSFKFKCRNDYLTIKVNLHLQLNRIGKKNKNNKNRH